MNRQGKVVSTEKNRARVSLMKHTACGDCGACQLGEENMHMEIDAINNIDAKVGNVVEIDMAAPNVLSAAFLAYGLPLIALILGVVLSNRVFVLLQININYEELFSLLTGLFFMFISYFYINQNENKIKNSTKYVSVITKIVE